VNVRVTGFAQSAAVIANMQRQSAAVGRYQSQLSSGARVQVPSDDPGGYATLNRLRAASDRYEAYGQTMTAATTDLNAGVSALQDVNDTLVRATQIASEAASGTTNPTGATNLASEVDSLIDRMMTAANAQTDGKYQFGGTATDRPPFQVTGTDAAGRPTGIGYTGAAERGRVLVGPGQTADVRHTGAEVFQRPGAGVFENLLALRDTLRDANLSPDARSRALSARMDGLAAAREAVSDSMAEQSSTLATIDAIQARFGDLKIAAAEREGQVGGTDYAETIVKLNEQQTALQGSLLDFIR
jgi:flagellar hook-associated protein 3 FlgL